jgi:hypothetical protein
MAEKSEEEKDLEEIEKIGKEEWESWDYSEGEFGLKDEDKAKIDAQGPDEMIIDLLQEFARTPGISKPLLLGRAFYVAALNMDIKINFTTAVGKCSNMYYAYVYQQPKWNYNIKKVSESMEVSPTHADAYNLFMGQRQKLEGQIKQGLTSAMQSVTDYELLAHDSRRYKEILDYFREGREDEHVLRSLFVDRVDAFTGEGYSMITMAKRWPTIITDFIRLGQKKYKGKKWTTEDIVRELDVTQAEATVLVTKDRLFSEWRKLFRPTVAERYARIQALVDARKRSIDEYKRWLKPYIARHKMMREMTERPPALLTHPLMAPAFGTSTAMTAVRLWVWKAFPISEKRKPEARTEHEIGGIRWIVDPLDDFVREWVRKIEYKYRLEPGYYTRKNDMEIRQILLKSIITHPQQADRPVPAMVPSEFYYVLFDIKIDKIVPKAPPPAGGESEDMALDPMRTWIASQNVLLIHLIELDAKERAFDTEVNEMIGAREIENRYMEETRILLGKKGPKEESRNAAARFVGSVLRGHKRVKKWLGNYSRFLFRPGPYESVFHERVVKMYLVDVGAFYKQQVDWWKAKVGVG